MRIGLHDSDRTGYPNLALMKLSAFHKAKGDHVEWYMSLAEYDRVYSSKVFDWTPEDRNLPDYTIKGGTGYSLSAALPEEIEHICPDYSLYGTDYSLGFLTRGCVRNCPWCVVPAKEGTIRSHADIEEFARHKHVRLMDNNILAHQHGLRQLEKIAGLDLRIDCNQGLDARLIDEPVAELLASVKWTRFIRLACDRKEQMVDVERAVSLIRRASGKTGQFLCYVLLNDVRDALERVTFLDNLSVTPFVQPYREIGTFYEPSQIQKDFARWANKPQLRNTIPWAEYQPRGRQIQAHDDQGVLP